MASEKYNESPETIDTRNHFCSSCAVKSLPRLAHLSLLALSLASISCATPANRRALYFSTQPHGPWTDYERRREAEAATGVVTSSSSKSPAAPIGPVTPPPKGAGSVGSLTPTTAAPGDITPPAAAPAPDAAAPAAPAPDATSAPITNPPQP